MGTKYTNETQHESCIAPERAKRLAHYMSKFEMLTPDKLGDYLRKRIFNKKGCKVSSMLSYVKFESVIKADSVFDENFIFNALSFIYQTLFLHTLSLIRNLLYMKLYLNILKIILDYRWSPSCLLIH